MARPITFTAKDGAPRHYVREWRKYRGLTQEKLAERTPFTTGAISQLETGRTRYTQDMLEALAAALECKPGDLLSRNPFDQEQPIRDVQEIQQVLERIEGLKPENIVVLLSAIQGFRQVNAEQPSQSRPEDQSEPETRRHIEPSSR